MAKTPKTVDNLLGDLKTRLNPGGGGEKKKLKKLKSADLKSRGQEVHIRTTRKKICKRSKKKELLVEFQFPILFFIIFDFLDSVAFQLGQDHVLGFTRVSYGATGSVIFPLAVSTASSEETWESYTLGEYTRS